MHFTFEHLRLLEKDSKEEFAILFLIDSCANNACQIQIDYECLSTGRLICDEPNEAIHLNPDVVHSFLFYNQQLSMPFIYINNSIQASVKLHLISTQENLQQKQDSGELQDFADVFNKANSCNIVVEHIARDKANISSCIYNISQNKELFEDDNDFDVLFTRAVKYLRLSFYNSVSSIVSTAKAFVLTERCLNDPSVDIRSANMSSLDTAFDIPIYGNGEVLKSFMPNEYGVCSKVFVSNNPNKIDGTEIEKMYISTVANYIFIEYIIQQFNVFIYDHSDHFSCMEGDLKFYLQQLFSSIRSRIEVSGVNTLLKEKDAQLYFSKDCHEETSLQLRYHIPKTDKNNPCREFSFESYLYICYMTYFL